MCVCWVECADLCTVQCLCASTLFYCAHWQTYVSGTLTFGTIDVTEGQIVVMLVMLTSSFESFFNLDIWSSSVSLLTEQIIQYPVFQTHNSMLTYMTIFSSIFSP